MNIYKIDYNPHGCDCCDYPYALFARKRRFLAGWQYVAAFKTISEAHDHYIRLDGLPIHIKSSGSQIEI